MYIYYISLLWLFLMLEFSFCATGIIIHATI